MTKMEILTPEIAALRPNLEVIKAESKSEKSVANRGTEELLRVVDRVTKGPLLDLISQGNIPFIR